MMGLILTSLFLCVISCFWYGFGVVSISAVVTTLMFCSRMFGFMAKFSTMLVIESLALFLSVVTKSLFGEVDWLLVLVFILIRFVFYCVVYREITQFIYYKEERRKE